MDRPGLAIAGVLVAILLLVLVWYPGSFAGAISDESYYEHRVDPASEPSYERRLLTLETHRDATEADLDVVQYEDLSPAGQELFDRTLETEPVEGDDWAHTYEPVVCVEFVLVCPGYRTDELPREFTYEHEADPEESAVIVETDEERYLFSTSAADLVLKHGHVRILYPALRLGTLVPFAAFLLTFTVGTSNAPRTRTATVGLALAATVGLAFEALDWYTPLWLYVGAPALVVATLVPPTDDDRLAWVAVGIGLLVAALSVLPVYLAPHLGHDRPILFTMLAPPVVAWSGIVGVWIAVWKGYPGTTPHVQSPHLRK